jgi:hypothetical protein
MINVTLFTCMKSVLWSTRSRTRSEGHLHASYYVTVAD